MGWCWWQNIGYQRAFQADSIDCPIFIKFIHNSTFQIIYDVGKLFRIFECSGEQFKYNLVIVTWYNLVIVNCNTIIRLLSCGMLMVVKKKAKIILERVFQRDGYRNIFRSGWGGEVNLIFRFGLGNHWALILLDFSYLCPRTI